MEQIYKAITEEAGESWHETQSRKKSPVPVLTPQQREHKRAKQKAQKQARKIQRKT